MVNFAMSKGGVVKETKANTAKLVKLAKKEAPATDLIIK